MPKKPPARPAKPNTKATRNARKRRVKTPLLMQMHATECAAACLGSVLAFFGRWVSLTELRGRCEVSRDGSTAAGILRAARHYGLECRGRSVSSRQVRTLPLPAILFWEFRHFLILEGFDRDHYYLNDPSSGRRKLTVEEFEQSFTGVALLLEKTPDFRPGGTRPGILQRLPFWLEGTGGGGLAYAIASGLMLALLALATPLLLAVFIDRVLGESQPWGTLVAAVMAAAALLVYGLTALRQRFLRRLTARISIIAGNRVVSRLLRLPIEFFSHRLVGELTARVISIDRIARGIAEFSLGLVIDIAMSLVFLAVMLAYDASLALIVLAFAVLAAVVTRLISRLRVDAGHALRREQGLLLGVGTLMINQAETLRMTSADDDFFSRWSGHQARELAVRQRFLELGHVIASLPALFMALGHAAVLTFGAVRVMEGALSLGTLVGFYVLAGMFLAPIGRFARFADQRQALENDMQRLDDLTDSDEDPGLARRRASEGIPTLNGKLRLAGKVELRGVSFGYNRAKPALIENFNLDVKAGQRVALVGPSGSGKSTISRMIAGLYQPWEGEILFDGKQRDDIPAEVLARSVSMVDQQVVLFSATVRDNITLWNPAVPDHDLVAAAQDAAIHDEILSRPLGYATPIDEDGGNLSGGQRQRMEIARALVGNPTILILDEATSALDAATEEAVDDALRRRGVTCLIVAHRLSTVRDCDEIIVLDKGAEVQRGTHDQLMLDTDGVYYRLVRSG